MVRHAQIEYTEPPEHQLSQERLRMCPLPTRTSHPYIAGAREGPRRRQAEALLAVDGTTETPLSQLQAREVQNFFFPEHISPPHTLSLYGDRARFLLSFSVISSGYRPITFVHSLNVQSHSFIIFYFSARETTFQLFNAVMHAVRDPCRRVGELPGASAGRHVVCGRGHHTRGSNAPRRRWSGRVVVPGAD